MTSILWRGRTYSANNLGGEFGIQVTAPSGSDFVADAGEARRWLSSRSLRKGKARELIEEEMKAGTTCDISA